MKKLATANGLMFLATLLAFSLVLFPALAYGKEITVGKKVLILNSYHQGYRGSDDFLEGFRTTLLKALPTTDVYIEYLDSIHQSGKEFDGKIVDLLRFKYKKQHFDLIFSTDDYAFNLLEKYRDEIFPGTPVVFCGTNSFDSRRLIGKHDFNGLDERPSFGDTLSFIFSAEPETTDVVVIYDGGVTGDRNSVEFRAQSAPFAKRARFTYWGGERLEELIRRVSQLQPGTVVFDVANYVENSKGARIPAQEAARLLSRSAHIPFYCGWEFMLGHGFVGGRLLNLKGHGVASAQMAVKILKGASPSSLAAFSPSPNEFMFDYTEMSRFGIGDSQLPPGSIVINRPPGFFQSYKVALLSSSCIALALALIGSFMNILKSRKALAASVEKLKAAQSELVGTARKAGMAEVATNVLHNVGNVLNSVNVSAGVLRRLIGNSKAGNLSLAVKLLNEHADDLGEYLVKDEQGRLLTLYLEKLAAALEDERQQVQEELSQLTMRVDHVKDIVATQQSYAGAANIIEPVRVEDLLDDALGINAEGLRKVTVAKETAGLPVLPLDRARVLQILVNLISNAKHAMANVEHGRRHLALSAELTDDHLLRIAVADSGEGIAPENLTRIFSHAFTTRKGGHGFGLHSSALAAKEMGGTLSAASPGPGEGATFILEIPITPPPHTHIEGESCLFHASSCLFNASKV
jgi:signal transduction histidine kinase